MCKMIFLVAVCVLGLLNNEVTSLQIIGISDCDNVEIDNIDGFAHESKLNPDGTFTSHLVLPFPIDDSVLYKTSFSTWKDNQWEKESFELNGDLCGALNMYIPAMWYKLADTLKVPHECPIPAGDYRLDNFSIVPEDMQMPNIELTGRVLIQTEYIKGLKLFMCQEMEIGP